MVGIVIVNWNTGKLLKWCLAALNALPERSLISEIAVIDNASGDDSVAQAEQLQLEIPLHITKSDTNRGFAQASNIGIRHLVETYAKPGSSPASAGSLPGNQQHILLLNPDTEMKPGSLQAIVSALEKNPKAGIVGPKLLNTDGSLQPSVRRLPSFKILAMMFLKLHRLFPTNETWQTYMMSDFTYDKDEQVGQVMGAVFLIRHEVLSKIGLLDERFWIWFEEVDYCKRVQDAGWQVYFTPAGEVIHHGGASFTQLVGFSRSLPFLISSLHYSHKHLGFLATIVLVLLFPLALLLTIPASFLHARQKSVNKTRI